MGFGFVKVFGIRSAPAKRLAFGAFNASSVYAALLQNIFMLRTKIFADHRDHAHLREVAGRERKVSRRSAQNALRTTGRRRDIIECNRPNYDNTHLESQLLD